MQPLVRSAYAAVVLVFAAATLAQVWTGIPLGHDEAGYASGGRALIEPGAPQVFPIYRPVAMKIVAVPGVLMGGSERALRMVPMLLSICTLMALGALSRRIVGAWPAILACAAWTTSFSILRRSSELLSDIPSLLCYLLALGLALDQLERGPGLRFLLVAPLAAAAFYLRYGNVLLLTLTGASLAILHGRALWRARWLTLATTLLFLALLVPHGVMAVAHTGHISGILRHAGEIGGRGYPAQGFVDIARRAHWIGPAVLALTLLGLFWGAWSVWRRQRAHRGAHALWLIGSTQIVVLGLLYHGEPRYLFPAFALLVPLGARVVCERMARAAGFMLAAAMLALALVTAGLALHATRDHGRIRDPIVRAATVIRNDAGQERCSVLGSRLPQIAWYARCETYLLGPGSGTARLNLLATEHRYVIFEEKARRQPSAARKAGYLPRLDLVAEIGESNHRFGRMSVYRVHQ